MTEHAHIRSAKLENLPRTPAEATDSQSLRSAWTGAWLERTLINARRGHEPNTGGSLYSSLTFSAAHIFREAGGPKKTTLAYPKTFLLLDPKSDNEFEDLKRLKALLNRTMVELGKFSLNALEITRRELSRRATDHPDRQDQIRLISNKVRKILALLDKQDTSQWTNLFFKRIRTKEIDSLWRGCCQEDGFLFGDCHLNRASTTYLSHVFHSVIPTLREPLEGILTHLEQRSLFSRLALLNLHTSVRHCIDQCCAIRDVATTDAVPDLGDWIQKQVISLLHSKFSKDVSLSTSIHSALDGLIATLRELDALLSRLLESPAYFQFPKVVSKAEKLTLEERDSHFRELSEASVSERTAGARMACILLDAIDHVNIEMAGISTLRDWIETTAALYIYKKNEDANCGLQINSLNPSIKAALERYANIYRQVELKHAGESPGVCHFIARVWLMAAGYRAVWVAFSGDPPAGAQGSRHDYFKVLRLYMNAIVSRLNANYAERTHVRNYVEAGRWEWPQGVAPFSIIDDILSRISQKDSFGWSLLSPKGLVTDKHHPPNKVHRLNPEYMIHNQYKKLNYQGVYYLDHRFAQLGLPLVGNGGLK